MAIKNCFRIKFEAGILSRAISPNEADDNIKSPAISRIKIVIKKTLSTGFVTSKDENETRGLRTKQKRSRRDLNPQPPA